MSAFLSVMDDKSESNAMSQAQMQAIRQALDKCVACMTKAEEFVMVNFNVVAGSSLSALPQGHELAQLIMQTRAFVLQVQGPNREELAVALAQKLFVRLYDKTKFGRCRLGVDWIMAVLSTLNEITKRISKEITTWMAMATRTSASPPSSPRPSPGATPGRSI